MSYLVLARKYRPRNFDEMVGQEHVVKALSNALEQQRLHHAYLFTGTRGVGKTTVSRILAKSLNCQGADGQGGITAHPCGVCQACRDIDAGRFVDYTELDAASNRTVDEVQSLLEQAIYKPVQGRFKVFMIDEVHMLTGHAFNAMLKTLEEPPEYLKFVLATTDPQKVPVTVLSRCLQFNLRPMVPETIAEHLQKVLSLESVACELPAVRLISRAARGSMRDALSLTDQAIAFGGGALHEAQVRQMLGVVDKQYIYQIIEALAQGQGKAVLDVCDTLRRAGTPAVSVLEDMALALQQMALYQSVPEHARQAETGDTDEQRLLHYAAQLPPDETQLLYSFCLKGREELGLAPDEYSGLVMVLLRILAFKAPPAPLSARASPVPPPAVATVADAPPAAPAPVPVEAAVTPVEVEAVEPPPASIPDAFAPLEEPVEQPPRDAEVLPWEDEVSPPPPMPAPVATVVTEPAPPQAAPEPLLADAAPLPEPAPETSIALPPDDLPPAQWWIALIHTLVQTGRLTALARELAVQSELLARDAQTLRLRLNNQTLDNQSLRQKLASVLLAVGVTQRLDIAVGEAMSTPAAHATEQKNRQMDVARHIVENDPQVQMLQQRFGGQIVPGSIQPLDIVLPPA